jgi:hypothetical protein
MLAFTWPWPAFLALSQLLTGSMLPAVVVSAAGATVAFWLFANELLDDRRRANLATALFTLCPFVLMLSSTYLNYVFTLALQLAFGWMLLRGLRTRSQPWLVGAGALWAIAFYARPYDGLLVAIPLGLYVLAIHRDRLPDLVRPTVLLILGAAPFIALALAANVPTSGSPLTFPTSQQSSGAKFFFGERQVVDNDVKPVDFTVGLAANAARRNLLALPTWLVGSWLALVPVVMGGMRLWRSDRRKAGLLIGLTAVWPVGYLFWFASALTVPGATHGLGPHYYLPMVAPLAILAAVGLLILWEERRQLLIGGVAVAVLLSYPSIEPKISSKIEGAEKLHEDYERQVSDQVEELDGRPAIVVLEKNKYPYVMNDHVYLSNKPDLTGPVLYAVDMGPQLADLLQRYPDRDAFKIQKQLEPGDDISKPRIVLQPLELERGENVTVTSTITNTSGKSHVTAFARVGEETVRVPLDDQSEVGKEYEVTWTLRADDDGGLEVAADGDGEPEVGHLPDSGKLAIGASYSDEAKTKDPDRVERRYDYRVTSDGTVQVLTGEEEWTRVGAPFSSWIRIVVDDNLKVTVAGN